MKMFLTRFVMALLLCASSFIVSSGQVNSANLASVKLTDLSFISGLWRTDWGSGLGEENWSTSSGDSMVGTFRFVKTGKARFYELMLIEQTAEGPMLRLKHFNPGLIGWEEKAQVYSYPLIEYQPRLAVFERPDKKSRLTFRRTSKTTLSVILDQTAEGKQNSEEFKFKLVK
jgi:Domain of unknown function (DUF6265)